jgi:hypothetical protein
MATDRLAGHLIHDPPHVFECEGCWFPQTLRALPNIFYRVFVKQLVSFGVGEQCVQTALDLRFGAGEDLIETVHYFVSGK